jgi:predicted ATPase/DNA-binding winged helix-turn-helix (wHTH) protein
MQRESSIYTFGRFQLDTAERRLTRAGQPVPLTPKAFDTLLVLVLNNGRVMTKDEIMRAVWPDGFVEESNLAFNISTLRKALGEGQNGERYIETVPKLGYRFVMAVQAVEESSSHTNASYTKRTNLPAHLTRFIGREREIAEVTALLQKKRLITLTGSGGVGKTRLALEAGAQLLGHFPDGVWLAEFAPLADETLVPATVAGVFHLQEQPGRSLLDMLISYIGEKQMLAIFDNCEHVIESSAELAEALLKACPNLHILATSREGLRVAGESIWRVPSLDVPAASSETTVDQASEYDAVQLFVEHAALVQPDFSLTQNNLEAVTSICRRLDGIPLAIEMAAAQLDVFDLKGITAELEHHFDVLAHGSRTAVPRHQTLRATLDWSYNLLSKPERVLLVRLSAFRGGFTSEAAQAVGEATHHTLMQLVRKSMVMPVVKNEFDDQPRYRLLETILFYAGERLREGDEFDAVQDRHLYYFLTLAEEPMELAGPSVDPWVQRMDVEFDNVRVAFERAMQRDDHAEIAIRLVYAMMTYGYYRGHLAELKSWAERAWEHGQNASIFMRARGKMALASAHVMSGAKPSGIQYCEEALRLFRQSDDRLGLASCLELLANNAFDDHVQDYAEEALTLARELGLVDGESRALRALAVAALQAGDRPKAVNYLVQAMQMAEWDIVICLELLYQADSRRALAWCASERARFSSNTDTRFAANVMEAYGLMLLMEGDAAQARFVLEQAVHVSVQIGKRQRLDVGRIVQPLPLEISTQELRGWISVVNNYSFCFLGLGLAELFLGNFTNAEARLKLASDSAQQSGVIWLYAIAQLLKTHAKSLEGGPVGSLLSEAHECLNRFSRIGEPLGIICAMIQLAEMMIETGNASEIGSALQMLGAASSHLPANQDAAFYGSKYLLIWLGHAEASIVAPALAAARVALGDAEFEAAYATGQRMSLDQAVELALSSDALDMLDTR